MQRLTRRTFVARTGTWAVLAGSAGALAHARRAEVIRWSGYDWTVFAAERRGPGPNAWAADCVTVNGDGTLDLSIKQIDGKWRCAEVMSTESFGLGTYRWTVESNLADLEPWAVLGLFIYDWQAPAPYNEIDIEASKWGWASEQNAGMVSAHADPESQTWWRTFPWSNNPPYRCQFEWRPKFVVFDVADAKGPLFQARARKRYRHKDERAYCNLWLSEGHNPARGATTIKLSKFSHTRD